MGALSGHLPQLKKYNEMAERSVRRPLVRGFATAPVLFARV